MVLDALTLSPELRKAPRALVFSTPPSSPLKPHPYLNYLDDLPPMSSNPPPPSLSQGHSQGLSQTLPQQTHIDFEPSFPPINLYRSRMRAQPEPFLSRYQVMQELSQYQDFDHHLEATMQTTQNVQNSLLPPFTTTSPQIPSPFHFTTTSITTIPPFRTSLPPSSTFILLDQSLSIEGPSIPQPQEHTCPYCQRIETIVNNLQNKISIRWTQAYTSGGEAGVGESSGNLKMSGNEDHHRQGRRFAVGGNGHDGRDPRDVEIEKLRQWVRDLEIQHEIRQIRKRIRELELQWELTKETESEPIIWDIGDEEEEYPFVNKYPSLQEPSMLVEEESCPVYDTDNEEESEVVYDTDGNDVDDSLEFELLHPDQEDTLNCFKMRGFGSLLEACTKADTKHDIIPTFR
nr:reverse transcriptase domain-containing protein [Tanacetum cinerariifolium]